MRALAAGRRRSKSGGATSQSSFARARRPHKMGQKVNPIGLRVGINRTWDSRWYADDDYAALLHEDLRLKKFLTDRLEGAAISRIVIERPAKKARITLHSARPGVVIGK